MAGSGYWTTVWHAVIALYGRNEIAAAVATLLARRETNSG